MPRRITAPPTAPQIADLLASGKSYLATAAALGVKKHQVTRAVRYWRAFPEKLPEQHSHLLDLIASRYRNTDTARATKGSAEFQRKKAAAARKRAELVARIAAAYDVPTGEAEQILADAEKAAGRDAQVRALVPPLKPAQAARALPDGVHPRSARAVRLGHTRTQRRANAWPVGSAACVAGR